MHRTAEVTGINSYDGTWPDLNLDIVAKSVDWPDKAMEHNTYGDNVTVKVPTTGGFGSAVFQLL